MSLSLPWFSPEPLPEPLSVVPFQEADYLAITIRRQRESHNGDQHSYVSARRLFWVIRELQAVADAESTRTRYS